MKFIKNYIFNTKAGGYLVGFFLCLVFWPCHCVKAQYMVSGKLLDTGLDFSNVVVEINAGKDLKQIELSNDGRFFTSLDWNKIYRFSFEKDGYVSKVIEFSTHLPSEKDKATIDPYHIPVRLFETFDGVDTVFFKNPVAKIRYDNNEGDFTADLDYSLKMKYKIDKMIQEASTKLANVTTKKTVALKKQGIEKDSIPRVKPAKKVVGNIGKSDDNKMVISFKEIEGIPPLKDGYPEGVTNETFDLHGRVTHRTVFIFKGQRRVFLNVKHDWGGEYYFIDQANIGYRCISKKVYHLSLQKYRNVINNNK